MLQVLCDLLDLVQQMHAQLASHVHVSSPTASNAVVFTANETKAALLSNKLSLILHGNKGWGARNWLLGTFERFRANLVIWQ